MDMFSRATPNLPIGRRALADDRRDLREVVAEDIAQQEDCAFDRISRPRTVRKTSERVSATSAPPSVGVGGRLIATIAIEDKGIRVVALGAGEIDSESPGEGLDRQRLTPLIGRHGVAE